MADDELWRKRLAIYSLVRFGGVVIFMVGVAIVYTNLVRQGGSPRVGAVVAILGVLDSFFAPRLLKRAWDRQDRERE